MMMVTCRWVQDRILLYLAGELDPGLAARLVRHLESCGRCTRVAEELAETQETLVAGGIPSPAPSAPPTLDARVLAAVRSLPAPGRPAADYGRLPAFPRGLRPAFGGAAAALVLLGAGFALGTWSGRRTKQPPQTQPAPLALLAFASDAARLRRSPQPVDVAGADAGRVAAALQPQIPFPVRPVTLAREGARLLGGRKCRISDGCAAAVLIYDWQGERVLLYETDARKVRLPSMTGRESIAFNGECFLVGERGGMSYALWCSGATNYLLVARTPARRLLRLTSAAVTAAATVPADPSEQPADT